MELGCTALSCHCSLVLFEKPDGKGWGAGRAGRPPVWKAGIPSMSWGVRKEEKTQCWKTLEEQQKKKHLQLINDKICFFKFRVSLEMYVE